MTPISLLSPSPGSAPAPVLAPAPFGALPRAHFPVILVDPPWRFRTWSERGRGRCPDGQGHYQVLDTPTIQALPVASLARPLGALCFLWSTSPMLPQALATLAAWGFTFSTVAFVWAKLHKKVPAEGFFTPRDFWAGTGYYTRANAEYCLLGRSGRAVPPILDHGIPQLVISPRREHSRKPDEVQERIEALVGGPYLELFARPLAPRPGWFFWGDDPGCFRFTARGPEP